MAEADQSLADDQLYIPIATPLRWSLVAPRLLGFAENGVAIHPLNRLERAKN
jgi:peptide/nickel transport system substrate-binding protein